VCGWECVGEVVLTKCEHQCVTRWEDLNHSLLTPISNTKMRCMCFVSKRERKPKERGMYRSNNGRESPQTLDQNIKEEGKTCLQSRPTISINS